MRRSPLLPILVVLALVAGAALVAPVWAEPGALAPRTRFTDGHLLGVALWGEPLARGELPGLRTDLVGWPGGADLRPLLWPSALLAAIVGPAWAVSLTFALVPAFNAVAGWVLGAALGRSPAGGAVLGGLLALHPWVVETLANGQIEQAVVGGAALQLAAAVVGARAGEGGSAWRGWLRVALPGAVTALVGWAAPHVALAGCVLVGLWALPGIVRGPGRARWIGVVAAVALGALAVHAYHGPSFAPGVHVFAPKGSEGRPTALADLPEVATLAGLVWPPAPRPTVPVFHPTWLGFCAIFGAVLGVVAWAGRRGGREVSEGARSEAPPEGGGALLGVGIAIVFAVLALGPSTTLAGHVVPLPWGALGAVAPAIAKSMSAYRMVAGAVVALAIAASALPRRGLAWGAAALVLVVLAFAEGASTATRPLPIPAQAVHADASRAALAAGDGPVLDLPLAGPECPGGVGHYLLEAAANDRPVPLLLTNPRAGYAAAAPTLVRDLASAWPRPDCAAVLPGVLARTPFTTVVLHAHDRHCPVPKRVAACLTAALGPGTAAEGVTWWALEGGVRK